jgi:DNA processing protein
MQVEGVGDVIAKKLIQHCGNAEAVFTSKKSQLQQIDGICSVLIKNLQDKSVFVKAEAEIQFIAQENISTTYFQEENYPERLKHCYDSPVLLFQAGNINLQNRRVISIVGTRQITTYGMEFTKKFMEEIAPLNPIIDATVYL